MRRQHLRFGHGFKVATGNRRSQTAVMVLAPGESEGGPDNRDRGSDQWLLVLTGHGQAMVNGKRYPLKAGAVLLIERGDLHEIHNTGRGPLRTVNVYVPPAYRADGTPLPRGRG